MVIFIIRIYLKMIFNTNLTIQVNWQTSCLFLFNTLVRACAPAWVCVCVLSFQSIKEGRILSIIIDRKNDSAWFMPAHEIEKNAAFFFQLNNMEKLTIIERISLSQPATCMVRRRRLLFPKVLHLGLKINLCLQRWPVGYSRRLNI